MVQCVQIPSFSETHTSECSIVNSGVPQGCVLELMIFILNMNDVPKYVNSGLDSSQVVFFSFYVDTRLI